MDAVQVTLETLGIDTRRLKLAWVSAAEAARFAKIVTDFVDTIKELGPNPLGIPEPAGFAQNVGAGRIEREE